MASPQAYSIAQHTANSLGRSPSSSRSPLHSRCTPGQPLALPLSAAGGAAGCWGRNAGPPQQVAFLKSHPHPHPPQQALNEARCLLEPPSHSCSQISASTVPGASDFVGHLFSTHIHLCSHALAAALLLPSALLSPMKGELAVPLSLPDGVKQVLADALLILRAAQTETSMTSRAFASWVLQSCSLNAAILATCWVQYAHRNQADGALLTRFEELTAQGLGLSHGYSSSSSTSTSSSSSSHNGSSGSAAGSTPFSASRLAVPIFSSSRQQTSSYLDEYRRDPSPVNEGGDMNGHAPQHAASNSGNGSQPGAAGPPLKSPAVSSNGAGGEHGSSDTQQQDEEEIAAARAAEAAAIEAAAVAAAGARSSSEEPPTPSFTTTSGSRRGAAAAGDSMVARPPLQRPLSPPPPRPQLPGVQPPDSSTARTDLSSTGMGGLAEGTSSRDGSPALSSLDPQDSMDGAAGDGSGGAVGLQEQLQQRQATKVQTVPMQLIPLTPGSALRDPVSGRLLGAPVDSSSSSDSSRGIAIPQIGPWVLTNSARHFPSAEAEVVAPQEQQQQQQQGPVPRMALRLEHVQQRSSLGEGLLTDAFGLSSSSSGSEDDGGEGEGEGGRHAAEAHRQDATSAGEWATAAAPGSGRRASTAAGESVGGTAGTELLDADMDVVHAPLTLYNNSRTVRGNPGLSTVTVERQLPVGAAALERESHSQDPAHMQAPSVSTVDSSSLPSDDTTATTSTPSSSSSSSSEEGVVHPADAPSMMSPPSPLTITQRIPLRQGAKGLALQHGDIIIMGTAPDAPRFRVEVLPEPPSPPRATAALIEQALARFGPPPQTAAESVAGGSPPPTQQRQHRSGPHHKSNQPSWASPQAAAAAAANPGAALAAQLQQLARQARSNLRGACAGYAALMHSNFAGAQANAYAWIAWAQAGGAGVVLHHWASSELERYNVRNARVVLAEALRKCPQDQPLYVLAAGVELAGGDPEALRECPQGQPLYVLAAGVELAGGIQVWPCVMAALKEYDKARVLFERGLEYHPRNTKIMNAYAKFEADVGGDPNMARELHRRAMLLDTGSGTDMHNRTAFALLEAEAGRLGRARVMLTEGLSRHPRFLPGLLALAKVQRLRGEVEGAQVTLRHASKCTHAFDVELLAERAALYRALGEDDLARAEEAHCRAAMAHKQAKKAGASTQEAWMLYERICRRPAHREAARRAYQRKVELGWLAAPGVPGPNAARAGGPPFRPLKRTQVAEARARAEAEEAAQAAAEAEAAAAEAADAARRQQAAAEAESAAVVEAWEEDQQQQQQQRQALEDDEQEEHGVQEVQQQSLSARQRRIRSSRAMRASSAKTGGDDNSLGSENGGGSKSSSSGATAGSIAAAATAAPEQQEWQWGGGGGEEEGQHGMGKSRSAQSSKRGGGRGEPAGEESDEDMGAPLLPTGMEPEDKD
ncbi:hypothetical protein DUNSADRAFT_4839 [Dunaliella salina]|uniref:Uncharacterized protein n=1 Tax=Dunaliella salina TaxID=3046 RepID=A0ABQ7GR81_DUNSA|nr:hypothetical protein DUNSADRAFT_4839 [Dunaliella salina]|eukprot:KAF5837116.1 hypothetical protein DUNSADRAFT_4839 [Dunaliella salina]